MKMRANFALMKNWVFLAALLAIFGWAEVSQAGTNVTLPFSSTFDCPESSQSSWEAYQDIAGCPGWQGDGGWTTQNGSYDRISSTDNNPGGGGGRGFGASVGDGVNNNGGRIRVTFAPQSELWVRFYMKYPLGFSWTGGTPEYQKIMYINPLAGVFQWRNWTNANIGFYLETVSNVGASTSWNTVMGGSTGDGLWHSYEFHIKIGNPGILEVWVDGNRVMSNSSVNVGNTQISTLNLLTNQKAPNNGGDKYISIDDFAISNTGYIGPLGGGSDTTPPTVSTTSPNNGTTVSGSTTISATASDNVGVAGVQFKLDGNNLGAEDTSSSYSTSWNTTSVSNGAHTLTAIARDTAGNTTTSSPVTVTVSNAAVTPTPTVSLTASPTSITSSQSSTLTWNSTNATSCNASGGWTGTKTTSGSQSVSPTSTTNYTLSCPGTGGTAQQTATVTVTSSTPAPTVSLAANPATITLGQSSTLSWSSTNATSCTASGAWTGTKAVSGSQSVSPTTASTYTLTCTGTGGNTSQSSTIAVGSTGSTTFFSEGYEDTNFAARGWYDITTGTVDTAERHSGNASLRCTYNAGGTDCTAPKRHKFTESDSVYVGYWVKYSSNFVGSGVGYHPHEFYFLTNLNGDYDGLAFDYLTLYLESHWGGSSSGTMQVGIQDGQNIEQSRIGQNLIGVTENRAVAGCNGSPSGYSGGCYDRGDGVYVNGVLLSSSQTFTTTNKNNWNHVEAYYRLNSISNGIGQADGIIRVWFNDALVFERTNAILRTGQRPTMKLNQFIFAPWIGDGSPVTQTMWIDDLVVASERPASSSTLAAPTNLRTAP